MSEVETILAGVLSPEKDTRAQAETSLNTLLQSPGGVLSLAEASKSSNLQIASLALVLFRKKFLDNKAFSSLEAQTKASLKQTFLSQVVPTDIGYLKKLGIVLVNIADLENDVDGYFSYISQWAGNENLKEFALLQLELAVEFPNLMEVLRSNSTEVMNMLSTHMADPSMDVVLSAVNTAAAFMSGLPDEATLLNFANSAEPMINVLTSTLQQPELNHEKVKAALNSFAELTEAFPRFWKQTLPKLVYVMTSIANATQFSEEVRNGAVEIIVTLIQRAPGMVKQEVSSVQEICKTALNLTYEVDFKDDLEGWNLEETDDVTANDPYSLGKDLLSKVAVSLGGENVLPFFLETIPNFLKDADWAKQHTGILALGLIAEGCQNKFKENLGEILNMIVPFADSENQRLKWATASALGWLCTEFEPQIQNEYHSVIVPSLLKIVNISNLERVKAHGAKALVNYSKGLLLDEVSDVSQPLTQYAPLLLQFLAKLLEEAVSKSTFNVIEEVLKAISTTATAMESEFAPYYGEFMQALKTFASITADTTQKQELRANCIKCIGHLIESVSSSPQQYIEDARQILRNLLSLKESIDSEDPSSLAINEVAPQFSMLLKQEFSEFLGSFVPELLQKASLQIDMSFTDADEPQELAPGMNAITFEMKGHGTKQLAINTTSLQHKVNACRILYDLVCNLKSAFAPYVETTVSTMKNLFNFSFNGDVRKFSIKTVAASVGCCTDEVQAQTLLRVVLPIFTQELQNAQMLAQDAKRLLRGVLEALENVQNLAVVGLAGANELANLLASHAKQVFERKVARANEMQQFADPELYTDEIEMLKSEDEVDDKILQTVMEVVGKLLRSFKSEFQSTFLNCFKDMYSQLLVKASPSDLELLSAVCMFDDYVEYTHDLMWDNDKSPIVDNMLKNCSLNNPEIKQSAVYGVGVCAQVAENSKFQVYLPNALEAVKSVLSQKDSKYDIARDCAVGALGKIALYQKQDMIQEWISYLPIKAEPEEAQSVNKLFLNNLSNLSGYQGTDEVIRQLVALINQESTKEILDEEGKQILAGITSQ